jgi:hypothetical protein
MRLTSPSPSTPRAPWYGYANSDSPLPRFVRRSIVIGSHVIEVRCTDCRQIASCAAFDTDGDVYIACLSSRRLRSGKRDED